MIRLISALLTLFVAVPAAAQMAVSASSKIEPDRSVTIVHEVVVDSAPRDVWKEISTLEGWRSWAAPFVWPVEGSKDQIETSFVAGARRGGRENIQHEFLAALPERLLVFRTIRWPESFRGGTALKGVRWIFELVPVREKTTLVRLSGVGFGDNAQAAEALSFFMKGNKQSLQYLEERFRLGPRRWPQLRGDGSAAVGKHDSALDGIAATSQIGADGRRSTIHEVVVAAPPEAVWQAISTADGWRTWAAPSAWVSRRNANVIETSYDPSAAPSSPGNIENEIIDRMPARQLTFRTVKAPTGSSPDQNMEALRRIIWQFELTPVGHGRTRVRLVGTGYPEGASGDELLSFFLNGNRTSLELLRSRFAEGPVDWPKKLAEVAQATEKRD